MQGSALTVRVLGATAAILLAAACGSATTPTANPTPGAATNAPVASSGGVLGVGTTPLGQVLVDAKGMTVYLLTADTPGHSSCSAQCLQYWPLVPAPSGSSVQPVKGIGAVLGQTKASNGAAMLTAGGWPLYTFVNDRGPGFVTGEGVKTFGGTWYAVSPAGSAITA
ncbi:MAG: hypothetical protein ABI662_08555, partial [Dermatophilaceae bacterium]